MRTFHLIPVLVLACAAHALAQAPKPMAEAPSIAQTLDRTLTQVEKEFVPAAEAMPDEKYTFAPTEGEFKGVRTFGDQVKHVASVNYMMGAFLLGEKSTMAGEGENGPTAIKGKADTIKYLNDSFAYLHKALAKIDGMNAVTPMKSPFGEGQVSRLAMATFAVGHIFDHYGQMVVYLRMNGIVPPASRKM